MEQRVLIVNKFYYPRGGDCIVALNTEALLTAAGVATAVFSMRYAENIHSDWERHFATEVSFTGGVGAKLKAFSRTMGWGDVRKAFGAVLKEFNPTVVHLHNIHSYLSPVLAQMAKKRGCRVVWTLHDYKLLCPAYACQRDGKPCEECFNGKLPVLKHRCMKGSAAASAIAWLEALKWRRKVLEKTVDTFICPSEFMRDKMAQGGFDPTKLEVLNNCVDPEKHKVFANTGAAERKPYYCYVGRLSPEKGVQTLVKAAAEMSQMPLRIAGGGELEEDLRRQYAGAKHIKFLGMIDAHEVSQLLSKARFSVMPSQCYDNNPLSVIESLCSGTPVAGARIGGIPELITDNNGITFEQGNVEDMRKAITTLWNRDADYDSIKREALNRFSPQTHLEKLMKLYGF